MTSGIKCRPQYQEIDGMRVPRLYLPEAFKSGLQYQPKTDDFFIACFPKSGTHWIRQIVTLIFRKGQPVADRTGLHCRSPILEMSGTEGIDRMVKPGAIVTHLPYLLAPISPDAKYLYVVRNPKDNLVSYFHFTRTGAYGYQDGEFNDYFEIYLNGENDFGDYFDHVLGWYEHRNDPNVMFLYYEELKLDTKNMVKKIAKFMGDEYSKMLDEDEDVLNNVLKYSSLEYMKPLFNDPIDVKKSEVSLNDMPSGLKYTLKVLAEEVKLGGEKQQLVRKGIVGDWRNTFTEDQAKRMDAKIEAKLKGTDLYRYWKSIDCI